MSENLKFWLVTALFVAWLAFMLVPATAPLWMGPVIPLPP